VPRPAPLVAPRVAEGVDLYASPGRHPVGRQKLPSRGPHRLFGRRRREAAFARPLGAL